PRDRLHTDCNTPGENNLAMPLRDLVQKQRWFGLFTVLRRALSRPGSTVPTGSVAKVDPDEEPARFLIRPPPQQF
ncbi:hypothetical protein, partial [Falsigemmobacter intermedius]|uniref:hypothetical protein n=1 Tax=Falsigemmobacter intermedius TaxID=1553448 RepID=UPI0019D4C0EE